MLSKDYILDNLTISKGAEIINDEIFVSIVKKKGDDCHTNSIFKAKTNTEFLTFSLFANEKLEQISELKKINPKSVFIFFTKIIFD